MFVFWSSTPGRGPTLGVPRMPRLPGPPPVVGALLLALGLGASMRPDLVLAVVPRLLGALLALVGVATLFDVAVLRHHLRPVLGALPARWIGHLLTAQGVLALALGALFLAAPLVAGVLASVGIGLWALLAGASMVSLVLRTGARTSHEVLMGLLGLLSLLAGASLLLHPVSGAFSVASGLGFLLALSGLFTLLEPHQRPGGHAPPRRPGPDQTWWEARRSGPEPRREEPPVPEAWQDPWSVPAQRARRQREEARRRGQGQPQRARPEDLLRQLFGGRR